MTLKSLKVHLQLRQVCHWQVMKQGADNMDNFVNSQNIATVASSEFRLAEFDNGKGSEVNIFSNRHWNSHELTFKNVRLKRLRDYN